MVAPDTSATLLDRLRRPDDPAAWDRFTTLYTPLLHTWAARQGFHPADAADLVQDVLVKLLRELPRYVRGPGQSFRGWLRTLATNAGRDFRRRAATRPLPPADGLADAADPADGFDEADHRRALVARGLSLIRSEFAGRTWEAFEGVVVRGRAVADVAAELGLTANAVYLARHRVLTRLRREIDGFLE